MPASFKATRVFEARAPLKQYSTTGVAGVTPTVAHSARISSRDLNIGPLGLGFIIRYHSSQTAPGMRPLRGQKSLP